jgi:NAD(P)-dependent dehydrogenase (short-subunit alcohol dehydrogenase family)
MRQRVLVTAGASGIGREIVRAFAANGAAVFTCDIDSVALALLQQESGDVITDVCDLSKRADIEAMVGRAAEGLGGLDVLVNNAGIPGPVAPVEELNPDDWESVIQINLHATFDVTRLAIPYLKRSRAGVILVMSSVAGRCGYTNRSSYATSKWGLIGFTKTLARELGAHNIRVNAILPGIVEGPRLDRFLQDRARRSGKTIEEEGELAQSGQSLRRFVDPKDIAALTLFLASDAAKSISGQTLSIDNDTQSTP